MNLLSWIVLGLITGLVVSLVDKKRPADEKEIVSGMILGILGALFGGLIANLFLRSPLSSFHILPLVVAAAGSLLVLSVSRISKKL